MLLLKVRDVATAQLLSNLRTKLSAFFGAVLSKEMCSNLSSPMEDEIGAVFHGLESLIEQSYSLYMPDDGLHGDNGGEMKDPDVLEAIHLHHSAHCEVLDQNKADSEDSDGEMDLDDDVGDYDQDRGDAKWSRDSSNGNRWHGPDRAKRGRGRNSGRGRHGSAKRGTGRRG